MIDLLNALHPDAVAAAKKEFTHREDELTLRAFEASFPIISANTYDPATQGNYRGYRAITSCSTWGRTKWEYSL